MKFHKQGLNIRKINLGSNHVSIAASLDDIAGIYQKLGEYEKALKCLEESLRIRKLQKDCDRMEIATNLFGMGIIYAANNDNERAMECYHSSLEISCQIGSNPKLEAQVSVSRSFSEHFRIDRKVTHKQFAHHASLPLSGLTSNRMRVCSTL